MADSDVTITGGIKVDTRTENLNNDHRQVVTLGDPVQGAGVAPVDATNGLSVTLTTAVPAGTNNIGDVDVLTLPALAAGTNAIGKLAANSGVDIGDVDVTTVGAITPGTGAANLGKAEDAVHASGDVGVMPLAVRNDAGTALAGTTGDYIPLSTNSTGALRVSEVATRQYVEDTAHSSGDNGTMALAVRRDANTSLVSTDGDYAPLQVTDTGSLKVAITAGAGSGGTSIADEAAFTAGTTSTTPVAGLYQSSEDSLSTGQAAAIGIDIARNVKTHEQYAPLAEDNVNSVIAHQVRPVSGSTYSASSFAVFGSDVDLSAKGSAGNLFSIYATNANASVRFLQVHNKATAPASTNVPVLSLPIPAGTANAPGSIKLGRDMFGEGGKYLSTGVAIGISTTEATFTAATTTDHDYYGEYI